MQNLDDKSRKTIKLLHAKETLNAVFWNKSVHARIRTLSHFDYVALIIAGDDLYQGIVIDLLGREILPQAAEHCRPFPPPFSCLRF